MEMKGRMLYLMTQHEYIGKREGDIDTEGERVKEGT